MRQLEPGGGGYGWCDGTGLAVHSGVALAVAGVVL